MKNIIIDENGDVIWENAFEKLEKVKAEIQKELSVIKRRYDINERAQMPRKLNFNATLTQTLFIAFNRFKKIPYKYAIQIEYEVLSEYVSAYMELLGYIKDYYPDFVGSKALFTAFIGISASAYSYLLTACPDPDVLGELEMLNDKLCEMEFLSAQSGLAKEKSTESKLRADTVGYGVNLTPDFKNVTVNNYAQIGSDEVNKRLASIFGETPRIGGKK